MSLMRIFPQGLLALQRLVSKNTEHILYEPIISTLEISVSQGGSLGEGTLTGNVGTFI